MLQVFTALTVKEYISFNAPLINLQSGAKFMGQVSTFQWAESLISHSGDCQKGTWVSTAHLGGPNWVGNILWSVEVQQRKPQSRKLSSV